MNSGTKKSRPLLVFYILVAYVVLQFAWWTFSMFQLNNEISRLKNELNLLTVESAEEVANHGNEINEKLRKRWFMISSEGAVFIGLLLLGVYRIRKTFKKESQLADRQRNFLLSVTHELKSPIASAKLQLQTLQKRDLGKDQQQEIIASAISDTERLNNLVENILLAARIDNSSFQIHKERMNLSVYISDNMNQMIQLFKYHQQVVLDIDNDIFLDIDRTTFPSIILNLFENAVKYSSADSIITLSLKKHKENIILKVADTGVGVSDDDRNKIFEKFYRVGNEDTRKTKGTGLGLYIVKHIVELHNGSINVKNNIPKGSIFEVTFNSSHLK
ncbi:MAG: two-component sensor histidine kinase [Bacteroidetes bacterium]|jgi:signal transduction histidine kinase|nr:two-component sensor histidine kinase [Bacteroidota bacterium]